MGTGVQAFVRKLDVEVELSVLRSRMMALLCYRHRHPLLCVLCKVKPISMGNTKGVHVVPFSTWQVFAGLGEQVVVTSSYQDTRGKRATTVSDERASNVVPMRGIEIFSV
jgi:hypothetical protein